MTTHPKNIPYNEWLELKKYIYQSSMGTGYSCGEEYRQDILSVMRDIEKKQVEKENGVVQNL